MPFTNRTKVVLSDNEQYTFDQLIRFKKPVEPVTLVGSEPPQATMPMKLYGFGVSRSGLIVEQELLVPQLYDHKSCLQIRLSTCDVVECDPDQNFYLTVGIPTKAKDLQVGDRPLVQMGGDIEITHIAPLNGAQDVYWLQGKDVGNFMLACGLIVDGLPAPV